MTATIIIKQPRLRYFYCTNSDHSTYREEKFYPFGKNGKKKYAEAPDWDGGKLECGGGLHIVAGYSDYDALQALTFVNRENPIFYEVEPFNVTEKFGKAGPHYYFKRMIVLDKEGKQIYERKGFIYKYKCQKLKKIKRLNLREAAVVKFSAGASAGAFVHEYSYVKDIFCE